MPNNSLSAVSQVGEKRSAPGVSDTKRRKRSSSASDTKRRQRSSSASGASGPSNTKRRKRSSSASDASGTGEMSNESSTSSSKLTDSGPTSGCPFKHPKGPTGPSGLPSGPCPIKVEQPKGGGHGSEQASPMTMEKFKKLYEDWTKKPDLPCDEDAYQEYPPDHTFTNGSRVGFTPTVDLFVERDKLDTQQKLWKWQIIVDGLDGAIIQQLHRIRAQLDPVKEEMQQRHDKGWGKRIGFPSPVTKSNPPDKWDKINEVLIKLHEYTDKQRDERHQMILEEAFPLLDLVNVSGSSFVTCPMGRAVHTMGKPFEGVLKVNDDLKAGTVAAGLVGQGDVVHIHGRQSNGKPPNFGIDPDLQERNTAGLAFTASRRDENGDVHHNTFTFLSDRDFALPVLSDYVLFSHDLVAKGNPLRGYIPIWWDPRTWNVHYFKRLWDLVTTRRPENRLEQSFYSQLIYMDKASEEEGSPKYYMFQLIEKATTPDDDRKKLKRYSFEQIEVAMPQIEGKFDRTDYEIISTTPIGELVIVDKKVADPIQSEKFGFSPNGIETLESVGLIGAVREEIYRINQKMRGATTPDPVDPDAFMRKHGIRF